MAKSLYAELLIRIADKNPNFRISTRHRLVYAVHEELVLTGFILDLSGMEKGAFYLTAFAQPLYVPHNYIFLTFGKRLEERRPLSLKHTMCRKIDRDNQLVVTEGVLKSIESDGLPFLRRIDSVMKIAAVTEAKPGTAKNPFKWNEKDPHVTEIRAYSWALLGDERRTKRDLVYLTEKYAPTYDWGKKVQNRCERVLQAMEQGTENARVLLHEWAKQSTVGLGLTPALNDEITKS